jgi:iron complex outermembrane receptor protein
VEDVKDRSTTNIGVFAESTYSFTKALRLTTGLRYDDTKVKMDEDYTDRTGTTPAFVALRGDAGKRTFINWTYKARLGGNLTDTNLLYGAVSTGVLPGDVQVIPTSPGVLSLTTLKAETLTSFESAARTAFSSTACRSMAMCSTIVTVAS